MHKKGGLNLILSNHTFYAAYDESNHGRFPQIDVLTMSGLKKYVQKGTFPKQRKKKPCLRTGINNDYSFLLSSEADYKRIPKKEILGLTIASLISDHICLEKLDSLKLFIDGEHLISKRNYIKDLFVEIFSIPRNKIIINSGANFDRKYLLVNWADSLAHYFFRKCTPEQLSRNPKRKDFIR